MNHGKWGMVSGGMVTGKGIAGGTVDGKWEMEDGIWNVEMNGLLG